MDRAAGSDGARRTSEGGVSARGVAKHAFESRATLHDDGERINVAISSETDAEIDRIANEMRWSRARTIRALLARGLDGWSSENGEPS